MKAPIRGLKQVPVREFIIPSTAGADPEVGQIIFVTYHADEILHRNRHAGLYMHLELREIDDAVGFEHIAGDEIPVVDVVVGLSHPHDVMIGHGESICITDEGHQGALRPEINLTIIFQPVLTPRAAQVIPVHLADDEAIVPSCDVDPLLSQV